MKEKTECGTAVDEAAGDLTHGEEAADEYLDRGLVRWMYRDLTGAVRFYRAAVRLAPSMALAHYLLGSTLQELGRVAESRHEFERVLSCRDNSDQARWARSMVVRANRTDPVLPVGSGRIL